MANLTRSGTQILCHTLVKLSGKSGVTVRVLRQIELKVIYENLGINFAPKEMIEFLLRPCNSRWLFVHLVGCTVQFFTEDDHNCLIQLEAIKLSSDQKAVKIFLPEKQKKRLRQNETENAENLRVKTEIL